MLVVTVTLMVTVILPSSVPVTVTVKFMVTARGKVEVTVSVMLRS